MSIPKAWGLEYLEVASLTWLAYKGQGTIGKWRFSTGSTWTLNKVFEIGGFRAVLITGPKTVLSFSGTDMPEIEDWANNLAQGLTGISPYYYYALKLAASNGSDVVVGHSLGGGLASYVGIYGGRQAATINPAPLNINLASSVAMIRNSNLVINYVAPGEALDLLDIAMLNMRRVGRIFPVSSSGGFNPVDRHLLSNLKGFVAPTKI